MSSGMVLDMREFDRAMVQYAAASKKDFADISNRQTLNLAIQGLKLQKKTEAMSIRQVESLEWWHRYVAKALSKKVGKYTKAQAQQFSKKLIRSRLKSVGFLKYFFAKMAQSVAPYTDRPPRKSKSFSGFNATIIPATKQRPTTQAVVSYTYRRRGDKTARSAEALLQRTLSMAVGSTVRDIMKYVDRKMGRTAKKYSARGA